MTPRLDDCTRLELKALARFATPVQIAEAKARIAREAASRANDERVTLASESVSACRAVRAHFEAKGEHEAHMRLFERAKLAARISQNAERRWRRLENIALGLERALARMRFREGA